MTDANLDHDYDLPSSYSLPKLHVQSQSTRKKRSKMVNLEPLMASSSSVITTTATTNSGNACSAKKYYGKKPDPNAPKITRPCSECGKKFWSWKALFGHMRCHPERQWRGINPPPQYRKPISSPIQELVSEGKESALTEEDREVASCLILLASSDDQVGNVMGTGFECSCCKKVFGSHQALGGHRASHKNVKGCFANSRSSDDDDVVVEECSNGSVDVKRLMVLGHKCGICMRVFSSGQALGGHKRCHWEKGEEASSSTLMNHQDFNVFPSCGGFDLNFPAPVEDDQPSSSYSSAFNSPPSLTLDLRLGL